MGSTLRWFENRPMCVLIVPIAYLLVFYVLPIVGVVLVSLFPGGKFSPAAYIDIYQTGLFGSVIWRTIYLSLIVTAFCLVLGYPYAYAMVKVGHGARRLMILAVAVPFFTSILIRSYAWVALLGARGPINSALKEMGIIATPLSLVFNEVGALIGMIQIQLPLMIMTIYGTMSRIDRDLTLASESLGAHRLTTFAQIFFPLSLPGVVSGLTLVFTSTLGFYVTPHLLGSPREQVATQSIFISVNSLNNYSVAAAQSVMLLIVVLACLILMRGSLRARPALPFNSGTQKLASMDRFPAVLLSRIGMAGDVIYWVLKLVYAITVLFVTVILTITMVAVVPLGLSADSFLRLPPSGLSMQWIQSYLTSPDWLGSTWFSIWISALGAAVATVLGALAAYAMARWDRARGKSWMELFLISPMIIPTFVTSLALYFIFIKAGLVGNPITYVIAYGVFGFPYVFLIMVAAFQRFDFALIQAAAILGAGFAATWRRVVIPVLAPAFASAALFGFLIAFDDLVVALFFSTAGRYTLPMRMWADIRNEISPQIGAVAVVFLAVAVLVTLAIVLIGWAKSRKHLMKTVFRSGVGIGRLSGSGRRVLGPVRDEWK